MTFVTGIIVAAWVAVVRASATTPRPRWHEPAEVMPRARARVTRVQDLGGPQLARGAARLCAACSRPDLDWWLEAHEDVPAPHEICGCSSTAT